MTEEAAARGQSPEALGSFEQRDQARPAAIATIQRATPASDPAYRSLRMRLATFLWS